MCQWYDDFKKKVENGEVARANKDSSAWKVPLGFLKEQVEKCDKEHMSFIVREKDSGKIVDSGKYELFIEGRNPDKGDMPSCAEDFPPIQWP